MTPKTKAAFFDRDGTIIVDKGYAYRPEDLEFIQGVPELIHRYNQEGYLVIIVTNQSGIARGFYTEDDMHCFHAEMCRQLLENYDARIDAIYYCPHHELFTGPCECRKPKPGLIMEAARDYNIDLARSLFLGDAECDKEAAMNAGISNFRFISASK